MILKGVCIENHLNVTGWHELFSPYKSSLFLAAIAVISFEIKPENASNVLLLFQLKLFFQTHYSRVLRKLITWPSTFAKGLFIQFCCRVNSPNELPLSFFVSQPKLFIKFEERQRLVKNKKINSSTTHITAQWSFSENRNYRRCVFLKKTLVDDPLILKTWSCSRWSMA